MTMRDEFEAWYGTEVHPSLCVDLWMGWKAATERAAKSLDDAADALMPPGKRGNAVDRHCADVLRGRAAAIRAGGVSSQ